MRRGAFNCPEAAIKQIFKTDQSLGLRTIALAILAIVLVLLDHHSPSFHRARNHSAVVVAPVDYIVNAPIVFYQNLRHEFKSRQSLIAENARLRVEHTLLQSRLQRLIALESENKQLQSLLQSSSNKLTHKVTQAQLLSVSPNPHLKQLSIDKGKHDKVFIGQVVIDAYGVVGQITAVNWLSSDVMLVTSRDSQVPVQDARSGARAIAVGDGDNGSLHLEGVTETEDVKVGDVMLTSGLGKRYPYGYPVAKVSSIEKRGAQFSQVNLLPVAKLNSSRLMLLIWPSTPTKIVDDTAKTSFSQQERSHG